MVSHEEGIKSVKNGLILLSILTVGEVFIALTGKGHIINGFYAPVILMNVAMIGLSMWKATFIVQKFMHMGYEVRSLALSVLLPCLLLIWAVIAFFWEGNSWGKRRELIQEKNARVVKPIEKTTGAVFIIDGSTYSLG